MSAPPLATAEDIRRHVGVKVELRHDVAQRILDALDQGAVPHYPALLDAALYPNPPAITFHTTATALRDRIEVEGLTPHTPQNVPGQPAGVYVTATPDRRGIWAHEEPWDVWEVDMLCLAWEPDRLNPGHWCLPTGVPTDALRLACARLTYR